MFRQTIFYILIAIALLVSIAQPVLFYVLAAGANAQWTLASFVSSNVPSIAGTLMIVFLVMFRKQMLGAPREH